MRVRAPYCRRMQNIQPAHRQGRHRRATRTTGRAIALSRLQEPRGRGSRHTGGPVLCVAEGPFRYLDLRLPQASSQVGSDAVAQGLDIAGLAEKRSPRPAEPADRLRAARTWPHTATLFRRQVCLSRPDAGSAHASSKFLHSYLSRTAVWVTTPFGRWWEG